MADIFDAIPAASLIYRWGADTHLWLYVIREVGGNLGILAPGLLRISARTPDRGG